MINYAFEKLNNTQYFLVCLNYESVLNYIDAIEDSDLIGCNGIELIIDQLLVAGNGRNRFISCQVLDGKINLSTAKNIEGILQYRELTTKILRQYYSCLKYSVLTDSQLNMILEGQAF